MWDVFIGSKFVESPAAKSLPLPPAEWVEEIRRSKHGKMSRRKSLSNLIEKQFDNSIDASRVLTDKTQINTGTFLEKSVIKKSPFFNFKPVNCSSSPQREMSSGSLLHVATPSRGIRLHPLQLIAVSTAVSNVGI